MKNQYTEIGALAKDQYSEGYVADVIYVAIKGFDGANALYFLCNSKGCSNQNYCLGIEIEKFEESIKRLHDDLLRQRRKYESLLNEL